MLGKNEEINKRNARTLEKEQKYQCDKITISSTNPNITGIMDSDSESVSVLINGSDIDDIESSDNDSTKEDYNKRRNVDKSVKNKVNRSFAASAILLATAGMVAKIIGAIYRIPLTNLLGVEGIGLYQLVFPMYALMLTLSSSAIPTAIARLVSEKNELGDYIGGRKVFKSSAILLVSTGLVATIIMFMISAPVANLQGNGLVKYGYYVVAPAILFVACSAFFKGWFQGNMNMLPTATSQIVEQITKMGFGLLFAYLLLDKGTMYAVTGALIGLTLSEFLSLVVMCIMYLKSRPKGIEGIAAAKADIETTKQIMRVTVPIMVAGLIFPVVQFADSLLIVNLLMAKGVERSLAISQYGILTAPVGSLINMPIVITLAFAVAIVPIISARRARRDVLSIKERTDFALKLSYLFSIPCFVAILVLARPLMESLYPSFTAESVILATTLMQTSALTIVLLSVQQVYTSVLQALGKSMLPARNLGITALVKITLDIILIYSIGIIGAVVSSLVAYLVGSTLNALSMRKLLGKSKNMLKNISKISLSSVIIGLIIFGLTYAIANSYAVIGVAILVSVPLYVLLIVSMRTLSDDELKGFPASRILIKINHAFHKGVR